MRGSLVSAARHGANHGGGHKEGGGVKKERGEREREGEEQYMFENLRSA